MGEWVENAEAVTRFMDQFQRVFPRLSKSDWQREQGRQKKGDKILPAETIASFLDNPTLDKDCLAAGIKCAVILASAKAVETLHPLKTFRDELHAIPLAVGKDNPPYIAMKLLGKSASALLGVLGATEHNSRKDAAAHRMWDILCHEVLRPPSSHALRTPESYRLAG